MSARQRRVWWAAGILCALAGGVSLVYVWVTNSVTGRSWLLTTVVSQIEGAFKGRGHLRVGTMRSVLGSVAPRVAVDVEPLIDSLVPAELEDLKRDIALGLAQLRRGDGVDGDGFFSRLAVHRRDADLPDAILMR